MSTSVRHTGIVVDDLSLWITFLTKNFDFYIWVEQLEKGEFISNLLGIADCEVQTVKLRDSKEGAIELLHFQSPANHREFSDSVAPNSFGITHIALEVKFLDSKIETLSEQGFFPISPVKLSADGKARVCYLRGPEQVLFELVELVA